MNATTTTAPAHTAAPSAAPADWQGPCAPGLAWSDALTVALPAMDETHEEFVALLAAVQTADDGELVARWHELVEHTREHFAREDAWMAATGFAPGSCHMTQHQVVLQVLQDGLQAGEVGQLGPIRQMAHELTLWFPHHAQNMDAGLALHLKSVGFDPAQGSIAQPAALPAQALTGCGGACDHSQATA
jgi:hemerythrin-like metal-binding protein